MLAVMPAGSLLPVGMSLRYPCSCRDQRPEQAPGWCCGSSASSLARQGQSERCLKSK